METSGLDEIGKQKELFVTWTKLKGFSMAVDAPVFFLGGGFCVMTKVPVDSRCFFVFAGRGGERWN